MMGDTPFSARQYLLPKKEREALLATLQTILNAHEHIEFAFVHGSFVEMRAFRDIDVAVCFNTELSDDQQLDESLKLAAICSHELGFPVDVHSLNNAPIAFRFYASRGWLISARDRERALDFREEAWARYFDFRPLLEQNLRDLLEAT